MAPGRRILLTASSAVWRGWGAGRWREPGPGGGGRLAGWLLLRYRRWPFPAGLLGGVGMMGASLVGEPTLNGWAAALAALVGGNWLRARAGLLGVALYYAVRAAYPPISQMRF